MSAVQSISDREAAPKEDLRVTLKGQADACVTAALVVAYNEAQVEAKNQVEELIISLGKVMFWADWHGTSPEYAAARQAIRALQPMVANGLYQRAQSTLIAGLGKMMEPKGG